MEPESAAAERAEQPRPLPDRELGGEPACLLPLLCPACDAVPDDPAQPLCRRCGAELRPS